MVFLSSIGSLLEGSGLRKVLETVYAPVSLGKMSSVKAYSHAFRGHFLSTSALLSIMLEEFWNKLNTDEKNDTKKMHGSEIIFPYLKMMKYLLKVKKSYLRTLVHQLYGYIIRDIFLLYNNLYKLKGQVTGHYKS